MRSDLPARLTRRGFNLIEALLLLALGTILVTLLIAGLQKVREANARTQCTDNYKQIGLACHSFESTFKRLPPLYGGTDGKMVSHSTKFPNTWGSTHVFLLPFLEQDNLYRQLCTVRDTVMIVPSLAHHVPVSVYVCPADPSMHNGIQSGGTLGGSSYAANAQVFAPLADEAYPPSGIPSPTTGTLKPSTSPNFLDRVAAVVRLQDGSTNVILFTHAYGVCALAGDSLTGSAWGYTAGANTLVPPILSNQPWSRASYIGPNPFSVQAPFQNQPHPFSSKCDPKDPATPHADAMIVVMGDASVRVFTRDVSLETWNRECLPNDTPPPWGSN